MSGGGTFPKVCGVDSRLRGNDCALQAAPIPAHNNLCAQIGNMPSGIVFIKWLGAHKDYDKIDARTVQYDDQTYPDKRRP
jgi:hypothetical protein